MKLWCRRPVDPTLAGLLSDPGENGLGEPFRHTNTAEQSGPAQFRGSVTTGSRLRHFNDTVTVCTFLAVARERPCWLI